MLQPSLFEQETTLENPDFLTKQIITQIGNKRSLLPYIAEAVSIVKRRLGKSKIVSLDGFAGSGIVSRMLKSQSSFLIANDIEDYSTTTCRCYLTNRSEVDIDTLQDIVNEMNQRVLRDDFSPGFIEELYAPRDENNITASDRVFYTRENARRIDNYRRMIDEYPEEYRDLLLGPLLHEASVHANTAGVFKGFYKDRQTGIGCFGGTNRDALSRILAPITMEVPVLSRFECIVRVTQNDANKLIKSIDEVDLAYYDPPYNQHPYGSNYFMLNLIVRYQRPTKLSKVSGIPEDWKRSGYNVRSKCYHLLRDLLLHTPAKFILLSYNNEGFISVEQIHSLLSHIGSFQSIEIPYTVFRGCRNIHKRHVRVTEYLFLIERR
ncbi:MAG: DNA adenine methylase [Chthonomonadetes bacterium]|nr:DNA adenine methylase [Chthonomonadetes bacterium]